MPILTISGLRKSFGATEVLKGIDLVVSERELVFIIGPSGSGKSTLLRCINRLEEPSGGRIVFDGVDVTRGLPISTHCAGRWAWCSSPSTSTPT